MSCGHLLHAIKIQTPERGGIVRPKKPSLMIAKIGSSDPNIEPLL
jgi:hypothetical protein